ARGPPSCAHRSTSATRIRAPTSTRSTCCVHDDHNHHHVDHGDDHLDETTTTAAPTTSTTTSSTTTTTMSSPSAAFLEDPSDLLTWANDRRHGAATRPRRSARSVGAVFFPADLLARPLPGPAAARPGLPGRVPGPRPAAAAAAGLERPDADPALPGAPRRSHRLTVGRLPPRTDPLLARRVRRLPAGGGGAGARPLAAGAAGFRQRRAVGGPLDALHFLRPRRAGLVRLRLGDPAPRARLPALLPLPAARPPSVSTAA